MGVLLRSDNENELPLPYLHAGSLELFLDRRVVLAYGLSDGSCYDPDNSTVEFCLTKTPLVYIHLAYYEIANTICICTEHDEASIFLDYSTNGRGPVRAGLDGPSVRGGNKSALLLLGQI